MTHEEFVQAVRTTVLDRASGLGTLSGDETARLAHAKIIYGLGAGYRGVCLFGGWRNGRPADLIEIAATGEESPVQLAGTVVHEMGHALAGHAAGHGAAWRRACHRLGLLRADAAGQAYESSHFAPDLWARLGLLPLPTDGVPASVGRVVPRPCAAGIGSRGGRSRGPGSGSRLRLFECKCEPPVKVRAARDIFAAHCDLCGAAFERRS